MTEAAVEELPTPLKTYFENYKTQVKNIAATEPPSTHFIDIDYYPEFFAHTFPRDLNVLIAEYGTTIVYQNGTGPWTAVNYYETLRDQFAVATTESDWTNLLATAGALSHYLEDLHNPMHLAVNYNGQLTGQNGLHSRYESTLIQNRITAGLQLATNLTDCVFHPSIQDAIFDDIDLVYPYNQTLLNADLSAYAATGERTSANYYQHLWDDGCSSFTSFVMQKGAALVASAWYAAWREAGFPQPPGVTASQLVTLRLLSLDNNGGRLAFVGDAGQRLELQTTTNLINWTWQATVTNLDGRMEITIPPTTNDVQRYYRAVVIDVAGAVASAIAGALNATNLAWTTAGNAPWFVQIAVTHDGVAAVRSGVIVDSRQSTLQTAVAGPGTLSFWWKVSSEKTYDYLRFYTNTVELAAISGEVGWEQKTFYLGDGAQTLQWIYSKDGSVSHGQDAGWLDEVTFLPGATPATIASPLANQSVAAGADVTLSVSAVGTPRLSYQWQLNGTNLPGANSTSLVLRNVQAVNTGDYGVVVSNGHGTNSTAARLTVNPSAPVILVPPSGQLAAIRGSGAFTVAARGSEPLTYQWHFNGADIAGATNSTLVLENIQATSADGYRVTVSNANGVIVSPSAALVVGPAVVVAWGDNSYGQTNVPLSLTNMTAVAGGSYHSLALRSSGTLVAWGYNGFGQANVPARATNVTAIAAGAYHSLALRADGSVVAWGYNVYGQTNVPPLATNVTSVAAGAYHSLVARPDGMALAWGDNDYGQTNVPTRATNTVTVAAGSYHNLALRADGTVVAWGYNGYGQTNVPSRATNVTAIAAGLYHSLALRADRTVVAWGYNGFGLTNVPPRAANVVAIAAGSYHNLALRADGTVVVWGYNSYGQTNVPSRATKSVEIAGGAYHSLSIVNDGSPFLVRQPGKQTVMRGNTAVFRVDALGDSPLNYQWHLDGINLAGATNSSLDLPNAQIDQAGNYTLVVTNTWGAVTSRVAVLTVLSAPWITQQPPAEMLANEGATVTLKCVVDGTRPLSYQWRLNGTNIPTATSDALVLANLRLADGGVYSVRVTNAFGSVISSNALLTINRLPIAQCREIILSAGDNCTASGSVDSGSFDPDDDPITLSQLPPAPYPLGTNDVILTATDNHGGSNFCLARVIVLDTTPPSIVCPAAMVLTNAHDRWTSIINFSPTFVDNCSGATIVCTPPSGSAFGLGTHEVRCVAVDAAGNSNQCSFQMTVWPGNQPPVPRIEATPLARFPGRTNLLAIAPNNTNATLVFDGSTSFDPDDESFNYFWYEGGNLFSTNGVAVRILGLGAHEIVLWLDDTFPLGTNGASLKLDVISPAEAVGIVMALLADSPPMGHHRQPLLALRAAKSSFERSHFVAGVNQLHVFQRNIHAQVSPSDPLLGKNLIQAAQTVIDRLEAPGRSKHGGRFRQ